MFHLTLRTYVSLTKLMTRIHAYYVSVCVAVLAFGSIMNENESLWKRNNKDQACQVQSQFPATTPKRKIRKINV